MKSFSWLVLGFFLIFSSPVGGIRAAEKIPPKLQKKLKVRLDLSQISFSNWAKGGDNTWSYTSNLNGGLRHEGARFKWAVHTDLAFGQSMIGGEEIRNTQDRIELDANAVWKEKRYLNPYISFSLNTQFARGYDYKKSPPELKSDFWDPAYLLQSIGFGHQFRKTLTTRLGIAVKETFTRKLRRYSDNPKTKNVQEKTKIEPGVKSLSTLLLKVNSNLNFSSRLELFSDLKGIRYVDVRWQNRMEAKVAKYVAVNLELFALYDTDTSDRWQWKQFLGVGLTYQFF